MDRFLYAGIGFGGSCFSKDIRALVATGREVGAVPSIAEAALRVNLEQRKRFTDKIRHHFHGELRGRTVALWGLAFKPGTNDMRDAPALDVIDALLASGATVRASDPEALTVARTHLRSPEITLLEDPYEAARGADALALVTEWRTFRMPDWSRLKELLAGPVLFDGRNVWDAQTARAAGFTYYGIGRP